MNKQNSTLECNKAYSRHFNCVHLLNYTIHFNFIVCWTSTFSLSDAGQNPFGLKTGCPARNRSRVPCRSTPCRSCWFYKWVGRIFVGLTVESVFFGTSGTERKVNGIIRRKWFLHLLPSLATFTPLYTCSRRTHAYLMTRIFEREKRAIFLFFFFYLPFHLYSAE